VWGWDWGTKTLLKVSYSSCILQVEIWQLYLVASELSRNTNKVVEKNIVGCLYLHINEANLMASEI
jgi:hypothetical protein